MSFGTPTFASEVVEAYNEMATLESASDFFVAGFSATDKSKLALHATGRGGMRALTEILDRDFESELAVAMFRVTALDERGLTVSRRTKLIHVIFIGPRTPVMVRAKVSSWNAALRQPFTSNLALQTDNARDDLTERVIEKALRASGGAHQPTSYDFENSTTAHDLLPRRGAHDSASPTPTSSSAAPAPDRKTTFVPIESVAPVVSMLPPIVPVTPSRRTPGGNERFSSVMDRYQAAFASVDVERLLSLYDADATLVHTSVASETTTQHRGTQGLRDFFDGKLQRLTPGLRVLSAVRLQPDPEQSSEGVAYIHWTADAVAFASETVLVSAGAIVAHTLVTDLEAESEKGDEIAPLRSEWPGGSTTASFGDQSVGDGTTTLDDPSTDGEHANNSDEEHDAARASTMAQPSDSDSLAPTLVSEEDPTVQSQMTGSKKGSIEGEEELNFGGDEDSVLNVLTGAIANVKLEVQEEEQLQEHD